MNGGFVAHERKPYYKKSRGLVVKDFLKCDELINTVKNYSFEEIEPFTAILIDWNNTLKLYELVWDGSASHFSEKPLAPHIWSSSPLYPKPLKNKREKWFSDFLVKNPKPSGAELLDFHKTGGEGDVKSNLIMDRGFVKTKSITQISKKNKELKMKYEDLQAGKVGNSLFGF